MDTSKESKITSPSTNAGTLKKNTAMPVVNMEQANTRLAVLQEDIAQFNLRTGGRMTIDATTDGLLVIVASLPLHRIGVTDTSSGRKITIDGKEVT